MTAGRLAGALTVEEFAAPELAGDVAGGVSFGPEGERFALPASGRWRRQLREAEYGSPEEDRELLERISPINNIEALLFVLHGANDPRVPVEKLVFEDEGHGVSKLENRIEAYTRVVEFLDEHA